MSNLNKARKARKYRRVALAAGVALFVTSGLAYVTGQLAHEARVARLGR